MTERLVEPSWLAVVALASGLPGASDLGTALGLRGSELVRLTSADHGGLLPMYEVRLARAESGEGPQCGGLDELVTWLSVPGSSDLFGISGADRNYVGLLDGDVLVALCVIHRPEWPNLRAIGRVLGRYIRQ